MSERDGAEEGMVCLNCGEEFAWADDAQNAYHENPCAAIASQYPHLSAEIAARLRDHTAALRRAEGMEARISDLRQGTTRVTDAAVAEPMDDGATRYMGERVIVLASAFDSLFNPSTPENTP